MEWKIHRYIGRGQKHSYYVSHADKNYSFRHVAVSINQINKEKCINCGESIPDIIKLAYKLQICTD